MKSLQGRVVVIAVGDSSLGRFLAFEFARVGARVALWTHDLAAAQPTADFVRGEVPAVVVRTFEVDLCNSESIEQAVASVQRDLGGRIDVLVNNTDVLNGAPLLTATDESLKRTLAVNACAPMLATRAVLPQMLEANSGVLVHFGTSADALGAPKLVDYCASKFAVMGFHEALRHELRDHFKGKKKKEVGISMTLVRPALVMARGGANAVPEAARSLVPDIWMRPDTAAKMIVRAVRRSQAELVLPPDFSMIAGLLAVLPDSLAVWVRKKLKLSSVMDGF
ncbi:hypothetical protein PybrP1_011004 [[Pythium] brassicae (nom. inval.)]|nr:hypothetical protein PybrP1_011004 [[Pythium] brassicae (nom. inval.)]